MIIYLHGFASTGNSSKVDMLRERFGDDQVIAPDLPFDPSLVTNMVGTLVHDWARKTIDTDSKDKLIFVGTSLGAFYANYFGQWYDCPTVLVNPSLYPSETLKAKIGVNKNYGTKEEFFVSIAHLQELEDMRRHVQKEYHGGLVHLFLAKDDDVIPYDVALEVFNSTASTVVTEDGGHRFDKHWNLVVDRIEAILKN